MQNAELRTPIWGEMKAIVSATLTLSLVSGIGLSDINSDLPRSGEAQPTEISVGVDTDFSEEIFVELPELPDDLDLGLIRQGGYSGRLEIAPNKIGDPHPIHRGARVCKETRLYKSDVARTIQRLGSTSSTLSKGGYAAALAWFSKKLAARGLGVIGLAWSILNSIKYDPVSWWANALAKITVGQARYVEHRVYCNYSGGYPAAYQSLKLK